MMMMMMMIVTLMMIVVGSSDDDESSDDDDDDDTIPRYGLITFLLFCNCLITCIAISMGIANEIPVDPFTFIELMPITSPSRFTNGPPLLPSFIEASV